MIRENIKIINKLGLHARAAAKFVNCSSRFASHVQLIKEDRRVNGKSIMGVMMLAASQGSQLTIEIAGEDERSAYDALSALVADRFGEAE